MTKEEAKAKYGMTTEEITENFSIERISSTYASCVYELTRKNKDVEWPSKEACLKFCDDRNLDGNSCHFGGTISYYKENVMRVVVYID